jgi:putative ABC transport system permease protein
MFANYLKTACRSLVKNKAFSFINLFGLTIALVCFCLIGLYVFDELTYDSFHKDAGRIFRLVEQKTTPAATTSKVAEVAWNISPTIANSYPAVEEVCRVTELGRTIIFNNDNTSTFYDDYYTADESFLRLFSFRLLQGDRNTALDAPNKVLVSEEMARKMFGHTNVVGKVIRTDRSGLPYTITGVVSIPQNSHLQFRLLFSISSQLSRSPRFRSQVASDWTSNSFATYVKLKSPQAAAGAERVIDKLVAGNRPHDHSVTSHFILQPLQDIHFHSADIERSPSKGNITYIYVFALVGLFVLLIACINYMNLTTARFSTRTKEIAIRKVTGAGQKSLVTQFITEALFLTIIAQLLSIACIQLLLPAFNTFTEKQLTLNIHTDYRIWFGLVLTTFFTGLLAGAYPAFFQVRLKPYLLLKNKLPIGKGHLSLRRVLVVLQFTLSIIMIIATLVVYLQLQFVRKKDLGFNKEQLVVVDINSRAVRNGAEVIKTAYSKLAAVQSVCVTSRVPGEWKNIPKVNVQLDGRRASETESMYYIAADEQFLQTFNIHLQSGRNFLPGTTDSTAVLINEAAAKILGINNNTTEQAIAIPSLDFGGDITTLGTPMHLRVAGIVKNFNFRSLREPVAPMVIGYKNNPIHNIDYFTAKVAPGDMSATLTQMENILHQVDPDHLFEYNFLDKQWALFYREDQRRQVIFLAVALMTILIACLGLFGLVTFAARQRTKEIGIRKVLGASISHVVLLLSKDFLQLVIIASLIAFPVAGWVMHTWLQDFAYRIHISIWIFAGAGLLAAVIAMATISLQAIRTALANPVNSLRSE